MEQENKEIPTEIKLLYRNSNDIFRNVMTDAPKRKTLTGGVVGTVQLGLVEMGMKESCALSEVQEGSVLVQAI